MQGGSAQSELHSSGSAGGRIRTSAGGTLLSTPAAAMPIPVISPSPGFQLPPPQLAALFACAAGGPPKAALAAVQMSGLPLLGTQMDPALLVAFAASAAQQQQPLLQRQPQQGQQERTPLQPPPDFAAAAVSATVPQRSRSGAASGGRHRSGTPGGPPTITSGALGGVAVSMAPRPASLDNG